MLGVGVADGKECGGVSFPEQVQAEGTTLKLNGLGLRQATFMKVNVYVVALYVAQTSSDANAILDSNAPKELILHFVRDVGRKDLSKGWDEGFEKNAKDEFPVLEERIEACGEAKQRVAFTLEAPAQRRIRRTLKLSRRASESVMN